MTKKPLIPTKYVNIPADLVYDAELSDPHFRTYVRLRGLAWGSSETPPLTIDELAAICHRSVRSTWGHLSQLREQTDLTWTSVGSGRMILKFRSLSSESVEPPEFERETLPPLQEPAGNGRIEVALEALAAYGVDVSSPKAREVVQLEHVTAQFIDAWGEDLRRTPGVRNLPGLLLYKLQSTPHPPRTDERRGGRRAPHPPQQEEQQEQLPLPELPAELEERLNQMGFQGSRQEIVEAWTEEPERVQKWADAVVADRELGVGFFVSMVRSGEPAPKPRNQRNRRRYVTGRFGEFIQH